MSSITAAFSNPFTLIIHLFTLIFIGLTAAMKTCGSASCVNVWDSGREVNVRSGRVQKNREKIEHHIINCTSYSHVREKSIPSLNSKVLCTIKKRHLVINRGLYDRTSSTQPGLICVSWFDKTQNLHSEITCAITANTDFPFQVFASLGTNLNKSAQNTPTAESSFIRGRSKCVSEKEVWISTSWQELQENIAVYLFVPPVSTMR